MRKMNVKANCALLVIYTELIKRDSKILRDPYVHRNKHFFQLGDSQLK